MSSMFKKIKIQVNIAYKGYTNSLTTDPSKFWSFIQKENKTRISGVPSHGNNSYDTPDSIVNGFTVFFVNVYQPSIGRDILQVYITTCQILIYAN